MKDTIVSLDTAKKAKEKGFNWKVTFEYELDGSIGHRDYIPHDFNIRGLLSAPTQALLQKWLRDVHDIHIQVRRLVYHVDHNEIVEYNEFVYPKGSEKHLDDTLGNEWSSYEEALEAGLNFSLDLL